MRVIEIKQKRNQTMPFNGGMGYDYMRAISAKVAGELCGAYPRPRPGCEMFVAVRPDGYGGRNRLSVQNCEGSYYVASADTKVERWPEVFGVRVRP